MGGVVGGWVGGSVAAQSKGRQYVREKGGAVSLRRHENGVVRRLRLTDAVQDVRACVCVCSLNVQTPSGCSKRGEEGSQAVQGVGVVCLDEIVSVFFFVWASAWRGCAVVVYTQTHTDARAASPVGG